LSHLLRPLEWDNGPVPYAYQMTGMRVKLWFPSFLIVRLLKSGKENMI